MLDKIKATFRKKKEAPEQEERGMSQSSEVDTAHEDLVAVLKEKHNAFKVLFEQWQGDRGNDELSEGLNTLQTEILGLKERITVLVQPQNREETGEKLFLAVDKALEELSISKNLMYHSPRSINNKFKELGSSIPEHELLRMEGELAKLSVEKVQARALLMKGHTEGEKAPLFLILPKEVIVDGKTLPFTIGNLDQENEKGIWKLWKEKKIDLKGFYVSKKYISKELRKKQWGEHPVLFTTSCLEDSKDKTYEEQISFVREKLGQKSEIKADMYPAMILHYILTGELLIDYSKEGWMRLHELAIDGDPLYVGYNGGRLLLSSDDTSASVYAGIGSAFVFSPL